MYMNEGSSLINFTTEKLKSYLIEEGEHLKSSSLGHRVRCILKFEPTYLTLVYI